MKNIQIEFWKSDFGKDYTLRNTTNLEDWDKIHLETWGITKSKMYDEFLSDVSKEIKILEVGCNTGMQLLCLQKMGFKNLFGIEIQEYAVELAKCNTKNINIIQSNGFDIPFRDEYFDLVFTSGVLIHIHPDNLKNIMGEIVRCSNKFILGHEYYNKETISVNYRGNESALWKGNYCNFYLKLYPNLKLVNQKLFKYKKNENIDLMFMLKK